ncbi:sugar porter family MFS transporter [Propionibacteriaceae bacterium Y1685]
MSQRSGPSDEPTTDFDSEPQLSEVEKKLGGVPREPARNANFNNYHVAFVAALGGLLYGYDTGVISGTLIQIAADFGIEDQGSILGMTVPGHNIQEMITAAILLGAVIGALSAGPFANRFGRRWTIITVAIIFAVGVILAGVSPDPLTMIGSRLFLGLAVGGCTQTIPTYIAELSPPDKRGGLVTFFNVAIGVGILTAALVNVIFADVVWHWKIIIAVIPAVILIIGMIPLPESPRWLVNHRFLNAARMVLRWVRPSGKEADREVREIQRIVKMEEASSKGAWAAMGEKWIRPALIAGISVAIFTQITGLEMMIYYTPRILTDAGFAPELSLWANVGVGVVYLVMTTTGKFIVDKVGRRRLTLIMLPGAAVSIAAFGLVFLIMDKPNPVLAMTLLLLFMFFQAGGIQVVGWLMGSELYPLKIRSAATGLHAAALWGSNLIITITALTLVEALTLGGAMLVYAALNVIAWLVVYFRVPETKGRPLEEIEESLKDGTFLPKDQKRIAEESTT